MSKTPEELKISQLEQQVADLKKQNADLEASVEAERTWRLEFVRLMETAVQQGYLS